MPVKPKRAPLVSTASKPRPSYGSPYQIYTEVANVGKSLEGSKKRVKWRFGFTEIDRDFEVEFSHSLVTGKKILYEDGKEITSSTNMLATEFSHSWNSENSLHIFRVEVSLGVTSEHSYMFLIDGQRFVDMPRKPLNGRKSTTEVSDEFSRDSSTNANRRGSTGTTDHKKPAERGNFQSPKDTTPAAFDPFEDSSDDVFKSSGPASTTNISKKKSQSAPSTVTNLLDDFDTPTPVASSGFDHFNGPVTGKSGTSNGFSDFPSDFNTSFASNTSFSSTTANKAPSTTSAFSMQSDDPFSVSTSRDSFAKSNRSSNQAAFGSSTTNTSTSSSDGFATFPPSSFDAFSQPTNKGRRASAQEIAQDFAGLSMAAPANTSTTVAVVESVPVEYVATFEAPEPTSVEDDHTKTIPDPWGTKLVNLDLTNHGARTKTPDRPIRSSVTSAPMSTQPIMRPSPNVGAANGLTPPHAPVPIGVGYNNSGFNQAPHSGLPSGPPVMPVRGSMGNTPTMGYGGPSSNPPANPFGGSVPISSTSGGGGGVTRGSVRSTNPSDPFQTLPALANPGFNTATGVGPTSAVQPPLSAAIPNSGFNPSSMNGAMTNNAMKSAALSNTQRNSSSGTSLDTLSWRPST